MRRKDVGRLARELAATISDLRMAMTKQYETFQRQSESISYLRQQLDTVSAQARMFSYESDFWKQVAIHVVTQHGSVLNPECGKCQTVMKELPNE
jgi:hypothetical protein